MSPDKLLQVMSCALAVSLSLCGCARPPDPQKTFENAYQTFIRGELAAARIEAHNASQRFSRDQTWAWRFRLLEGEILVDQGQSKDALLLLNSPVPSQLSQTDLAIKQEILRGTAYIPLGQLEDADRSLTTAEHLSDTSHSLLSGEIARSRGTLELARNNLETAARYYRLSLQVARQQHDAHLELTDLLNLGAVAETQEHFDEAIDWSNDAYRIAGALHDQHTAEVALANLAWAHYKLGDFAGSLVLSEEAEKKAGEIGASYDQMLWLNNIGLAYYQLGRFSTAEEYYTRYLALAQKNGAPQPIIDAFTSLAFVSVQNSKLTDAQRYSEQAFQRANARNDRISELYPLLVKGQVLAVQGNHRQAEELFREVSSDPKSDLSLRWQAQNDLARLYEQEHQLAAADKQYRAALATIEQARSTLQREEFKLPFMANAAHLYDDYIRFLVAEGKDREALQFADYSRARTLAEGLGVLPAKAGTEAPVIDAQQVARNAHATVLFYWLGRERSYLWAITANRTERFSLPSAPEIDAAVQSYRQALLRWQDVLATANAGGSHLYDILVKPAEELIPHNSRVILITDGSLDSLNFETLLAPGPPLHYWIEDADVMSASSLRVLAASQSHQPHRAGKILLIGDPVSESPDYAALPNAPREVESIENHFPEGARSAYIHDQATPAAYLGSDPGQFSFIHFVAHATASKLSPLDSAIILSRSSSEQDSFKLYARDVTHYPLRADLVTISSCYGAGDQAYSGEGLVGLSWAFLRAGAHNVIGALWNVSDASTATLMDHLYNELNRGQPPESALRSAKLWLLHSNSVARKPFYWAPFQLYIGK
jgi:CHAT domain-containing protein